MLRHTTSRLSQYRYVAAAELIGTLSLTSLAIHHSRRNAPLRIRSACCRSLVDFAQPFRPGTHRPLSGRYESHERAHHCRRGRGSAICKSLPQVSSTLAVALLPAWELRTPDRLCISSLSCCTCHADVEGLILTLLPAERLHYDHKRYRGRRPLYKQSRGHYHDNTYPG